MNEPTRTRTAATKRLRMGPGFCLALVSVAAIVLVAPLSAQPAPLRVTRDGDRIRLAAPQLHFIEGPPLQQLRDGRSVTYVFTLTLQVERGQRTQRLVRQVVFSYDLWEERFSVTAVGEPKASASRLTAAGAEAWCLELLSLPASAIPADKSFVLKFDGTLKEDPPEAGDAPSATTLSGLIDLFSRKTRDAPPRWEAASPPLRLADLKDKGSR